MCGTSQWPFPYHEICWWYLWHSVRRSLLLSCCYYSLWTMLTLKRSTRKVKWKKYSCKKKCFRYSASISVMPPVHRRTPLTVFLGEPLHPARWFFNRRCVLWFYLTWARLSGSSVHTSKLERDSPGFYHAVWQIISHFMSWFFKLSCGNTCLKMEWQRVACLVHLWETESYNFSSPQEHDSTCVQELAPSVLSSVYWVELVEMVYWAAYFWTSLPM